MHTNIIHRGFIFGKVSSEPPDNIQHPSGVGIAYLRIVVQSPSFHTVNN